MNDKMKIILCIVLIITISSLPQVRGGKTIKRIIDENETSGIIQSTDDDDLYIPFLYMIPVPLSYMGSVWSTYYIRVFLGTPPQPLSALVDGGLDLFTVYGEECKVYPCQKHTFYNSMSYTFQPNGTALNYTYGGGSITVTGQIASDVVSIAGMNRNNFTFGLVETIAEPSYFPNVSNTAINAIFGFAYPTQEWGALSLIQQYNGFNQYLQEVIAIWMPDSIYEKGQLALGGPDPTRYTGSISYIPLLPSTWAQKDYNFFWSGVVEDVLVNGVSTGVCTKKVCNFFIDLAGKPMDLASSIPTINVNPNCENIEELPTITLIINSIVLEFAPEDYVVKYATASKSVQCESGISGGGKILYPFTLGYTFMRNYYTILDFRNQLIGFAKGVN